MTEKARTDTEREAEQQVLKNLETHLKGARSTGHSTSRATRDPKSGRAGKVPKRKTEDEDPGTGSQGIVERVREEDKR